jgi:hypothetical protein
LDHSHRDVMHVTDVSDFLTNKLCPLPEEHGPNLPSPRPPPKVGAVTISQSHRHGQAAVSDTSAVAEAPQLAIRPAAGKRLAHVEEPVTHSDLSMGQLVKSLPIHEGQVIVGDSR